MVCGWFGLAPEFRATVESVLNETETLSEFLESAVRETVSRRRNQAEFLARGIRSLQAAKQASSYVDADDVVDKLRLRLADAKERASKDSKELMTYRVQLTGEAQVDLLRRYDFLLGRELSRVGGTDEFAIADKAITAIEDGLATLQRSPFTCRKAALSPFLREWVIPIGATGYVALFEISGPGTVVIAAVRHQREDGYH